MGCLPADTGETDASVRRTTDDVQQTRAPLEIAQELLEKRSFGEAPMLADRVSRGELPPVSERLPENPLVIVPMAVSMSRARS